MLKNRPKSRRLYFLQMVILCGLCQCARQKFFALFFELRFLDLSDNIEAADPELVWTGIRNWSYYTPLLSYCGAILLRRRSYSTT